MRPDGARRVTFSETAPAFAPPPQSMGDEEAGPLSGGHTDCAGPARQCPELPQQRATTAAVAAAATPPRPRPDCAQHPPHAPADGEQQQAPRPGWYARFKGAVRSLKREVLALYYALHDPRTPWACKLLPWLVLAYALSPLDLIPDFIPVLVRFK